MDTRYLESFVIVAQCESIAEAARRLNLTPAAVAQRLHKLEETLGYKLVVRHGRTVRPSVAGLAVLRNAGGILESVRNLQAIAAIDQPAGQIRLGATSTALSGLVPDILLTLKRRFPRIEYFVKPGVSSDLYHDVLSGALDAAFLVQPTFVMSKSVGWITLRDEPMTLIASEGTSLEDPHEVIRREPFIRYDRNQWGGQIVDRYLRQHSLKVNEWVEIDALDAIATLVNRGLGVALVPDWAPPWPEGLRLNKVHLTDCAGRQTGLMWNLTGPRIVAVTALVNTAAEVFSVA